MHFAVVLRELVPIGCGGLFLLDPGVDGCGGGKGAYGIVVEGVDEAADGGSGLNLSGLGLEDWGTPLGSV